MRHHKDSIRDLIADELTREFGHEPYGAEAIFPVTLDNLGSLINVANRKLYTHR